MSKTTKMIEARATTEQIRRVYSLGSYLYSKFITPLEGKLRRLSLERAGIQSNDQVLEVAVGPGSALLEILKRVDRTTTVYGVDLSPKMLGKTRLLVNKAGYANIDLREGDARQLPFPDGMFDVLYNSYMLDLLPLRDIPIVLNNFRRVLKPGGRLVLVNMSKKCGARLTWWERLYMGLPAHWVPYLLGGCRPLMMEGYVKAVGFEEVKREFVRSVLPSEIITARKASV